MATLWAEDREMMRFLLLLMVIVVVAVGLTYYQVDFNPSKETCTPVAKKVEKQPKRKKLGLLLEYRDQSVADALARRVRVVCWVMTQPRNRLRAQRVRETWGKRCNVLLFMTTSEDTTRRPDPESVPTVALPVEEGEEYQWGKTKAAFRYVYDNYRDEADWFLKTDDDTYVIVENLRYMLAEYDSNSPLYFGCRFKFKEKNYMSGGAGYVLSRAALDKFAVGGLADPRLCRAFDHGEEDREMGKCLTNMGVKLVDTRDTLRRGRFFPFPLRDMLFPNKDPRFWYWSYVYYPPGEGLECCSEYAISFHYIGPNTMYELDYLIYNLRPYGIEYKTAKQPRRLGAKATRSSSQHGEISETSTRITLRDFGTKHPPDVT